MIHWAPRQEATSRRSLKRVIAATRPASDPRGHASRHRSRARGRSRLCRHRVLLDATLRAQREGRLHQRDPRRRALSCERRRQPHDARYERRLAEPLAGVVSGRHEDRVREPAVGIVGHLGDERRRHERDADHTQYVGQRTSGLVARRQEACLQPAGQPRRDRCDGVRLLVRHLHGSHAAAVAGQTPALVAFDSTLAGDGIDIYVIAADGGTPTRLTHTRASRQPAWSPDGRQIAYTGYPFESSDLFVMNADGSQQRDITNTRRSEEYEPSWSPAGIAFRSNIEGRDGVWVMRADGGGAHRITTGQLDVDPNWARDGSKFVFSSGRDATSEITVYDGPGGGYRPLTNGPWFDTDPAWSSNGHRVAFSRSRVFGKSNIFAVAEGGGAARRITHLAGQSWAPTWSPD